MDKTDNISWIPLILALGLIGLALFGVVDPRNESRPWEGIMMLGGTGVLLLVKSFFAPTCGQGMAVVFGGTFICQFFFDLPNFLNGYDVLSEWVSLFLGAACLVYGFRFRPNTFFCIMGTSPTASPSSLEGTLKGSTVVQAIELWDYVAIAWESIETSYAINDRDSIATATATGDLSRFVNQATLELQARIHFQTLRARQRFASNTDKFVWTIRQ